MNFERALGIALILMGLFIVATNAIDIVNTLSEKLQ